MCYCSVGFSKYMRHRDQINQHLFDPESERTLHRLRREQRTEQIRNPIIIENTEEQNLGIEQTEPQRGRNRNHGRNQAPRPFIQLDDPFMLLDEFVLPPTVVQTAIMSRPRSRSDPIGESEPVSGAKPCTGTFFFFFRV